MRVRIGSDDFELQPQLGMHLARVASDARGGYVLAEVAAVHTHACVSRRHGRRNHHKGCNCGADELLALAESRDAAMREGKE